MWLELVITTLLIINTALLAVLAIGVYDMTRILSAIEGLLLTAQKER